MHRKDIFMSCFKSKTGYLFTYKDLTEFEAVINLYEQQVKNQKEVIDKIKNLIKSEQNGICVSKNEERNAYPFLLDFEEAREFVWGLEDILKEVSE